jgi:AcrR family transcriptional regulator
MTYIWFARYMDGDHLASPRRGRGAPPAGQRLTRDAVVTSAMEAIGRDGLASFSLRSLADALGVVPNAIYNHVKSREDLLDAVAERFVSDIRLPAEEHPWPEWVRAAAAALRAQLLERPGLAELVLRRAGATATGPELLARFLDRLQGAGLDRATAHVAWHAVLTVVLGSVQQDLALSVEQETTFDAVLEVTITGLASAAAQAPSARATTLLNAHRL